MAVPASTTGIAAPPATRASTGGGPSEVNLVQALASANSSPGAVFGWGANHVGQLGAVTSGSPSNVPVPASGLTNVTQVSAHHAHSLGLLSDGTVKAWGDNRGGQLGNGTTGGFSNVPVVVSGLTSVVAVSAGAGHSLALLANGTVKAWGDNSAGQLGNGTTGGSSNVPVVVPGLANVVAVSAGGVNSFALLANGSIRAWGDNSLGQLGSGLPVASSGTPVTVSGIAKATAIVGGENTPLAILSNGTVRSWGDNRGGQLGNGTTGTPGAPDSFSSVPVVVSGLANVTAVSSFFHSLALLSDGTVKAWGSNGSGELGPGVIGNLSNMPVSVPGLGSVTSVAAGAFHSMALRASGVVVAWGSNSLGELGTGSTDRSNKVPAAVSGIVNASAISAGLFYSLAVVGPQADLTVIKTKTGSSTATVGVPISYSIKVTNHGPDAALGVLLVDVLKSNGTEKGGAFGLTSVTPTAQGSCNVVAGRLVCDLHDIANGASVVVTVRVTPPDVGTLINTASVDRVNDPRPGDNSSTVTTTVSSGRYVALGDSYSSGEGAIDSNNNASFRSDSNSVTNQCHRSDNAYGPLIWKETMPDAEFVFKACSGAIVADFVANLGPTVTNLLGVPIGPFGQWTDGAQLDAISAADSPSLITRLVTLSVGGNDVGFPFVLNDCVSLTVGGLRIRGETGCLNSIQSHLDKGLQLLKDGGTILVNRTRVDPFVPGLGNSFEFCNNECVQNNRGTDPANALRVVTVPSLAQLYKMISQRAPNARIRVLQYPRLFPQTPPDECQLGSGWSLTSREMTAMNSAADSLATLIADQVALARRQQPGLDIDVVDSRTDFVGHAICDTRPWINGLIFNGVIPSVFSFHPNKDGQRQFANEFETMGTDLQVSKAGPKTATVGTPINYSIAVRNAGPHTARNVLLVDVLKSNGVEKGGAFGVATVAPASQGSCSVAQGRLVCDLHDIPSGTAVSIAVVVKPPDIGTLVNTASVDAAGDPRPGDNNSFPVRTTVGGPPSSLKRYLALGDSVPYGHGYANPTKDVQDNLSPNGGPSVLAWPEQVRKGLPALAPLRYRPTGCSLVGSDGSHYDQLAISGAPAIDNPYTGPDTDCTSSSATQHKAVFFEEVSAAELKANPPALVTIQAGADDINFAACMKAILGLPAGLFSGITGAEDCVTRDRAGNYQVTPRVRVELQFLKLGLIKSIQFIHSNAPNAQIVLVDYYQVIPTATADLAGTSPVCADLRFSTKGSAFRTSIRKAGEVIQKELNTVIKSLPSMFPDVAVVDIANTFSGHEMCTTDTWQFDAIWNAAHPTEPGQNAIARAVLDKCATLKKKCIGR